jgi:hypothetical protein
MDENGLFHESSETLLQLCVFRIFPLHMRMRVVVVLHYAANIWKTGVIHLAFFG